MLFSRHRLQTRIQAQIVHLGGEGTLRGKCGREKRKGRHLIKGELSNQLLQWVPGGEFPGETLRNGAKHSLRFLSSDGKRAGVFYIPALESYRMRPTEEKGILIPQNPPADQGQSGLWGATLRHREANPDSWKPTGAE